jgi:hypothetical protein
MNTSKPLEAMKGGEYFEHLNDSRTLLSGIRKGVKGQV